MITQLLLDKPENFALYIMRYYLSAICILSITFFYLILPQYIQGASPKGLVDVKETVPDSYYIKDVPFFPQEDYYCGPASLASVLNFYGKKLEQEEIAKDVFLPSLKGSLTIDLLNYTKNLGFETKFYKGNIKAMKDSIMAGRPLILFLNLGNNIYPIRHYVVVVGFNDNAEYVITYSGRKKDKVYSYKRLLNAWERTGFGTLQILPGVNM